MRAFRLNSDSAAARFVLTELTLRRVFCAFLFSAIQIVLFQSEFRVIMRTYSVVSFIALSITLLVGCDRSSEPTAENSPVGDHFEAKTVEFSNAKCPIMGGKPKSELTAQYNGGTIGFCCEGCPEKWALLSEQEQAEKFVSANENPGDEEAEL